MANLILTNCDFLVPVDRVCWGTQKHIEAGHCQDCSIYAEKKKSRFSFKKARVNNSKNVSINFQPCGVTVEASH